MFTLSALTCCLLSGIFKGKKLTKMFTTVLRPEPVGEQGDLSCGCLRLQVFENPLGGGDAIADDEAQGAVLVFFTD